MEGWDEPLNGLTDEPAAPASDRKMPIEDAILSTMNFWTLDALHQAMTERGYGESDTKAAIVAMLSVGKLRMTADRKLFVVAESERLRGEAKK